MNKQGPLDRECLDRNANTAATRQISDWFWPKYSDTPAPKGVCLAVTQSKRNIKGGGGGFDVLSTPR